MTVHQHIELGPEWGLTFPVWDASGDPGLIGPVEPEDLDLSPELVDRLEAWQSWWTVLADIGLDQPEPEDRDGRRALRREWARWNRTGHELADQVRAELPGVRVDYPPIRRRSLRGRLWGIWSWARHVVQRGGCTCHRGPDTVAEDGVAGGG